MYSIMKPAFLVIQWTLLQILELWLHWFWFSLPAGTLFAFIKQLSLTGQEGTHIMSQDRTLTGPRRTLYASLTLTQQAVNPALIGGLLEYPPSFGSGRASGKLFSGVKEEEKQWWLHFKHLFLSSVIRGKLWVRKHPRALWSPGLKTFIHQEDKTVQRMIRDKLK